MKLNAKLYYDGVLQKQGKVTLGDATLDFVRNDKRYIWKFLEYLKINDKTNTIKIGQWKAIFTPLDIKKIQKKQKKHLIKSPIKSSVKRHSVKRHSVKRHSVKRHSVKRRSVKRHSVKRHSVKRRSVKRHSVKRRSVKRHSVKRRSVKRK